MPLQVTIPKRVKRALDLKSVETGRTRRALVLEALRGGAFDLVILGATLSKDDRHHLPYMVKKANAATKVLVMHAGTHHHEVDAAVDPTMSMHRILEKIAALLQSAPAR